MCRKDCCSHPTMSVQTLALKPQHQPSGAERLCSKPFHGNGFNIGPSMIRQLSENMRGCSSDGVAMVNCKSFYYLCKSLVFRQYSSIAGKWRDKTTFLLKENVYNHSFTAYESVGGKPRLVLHGDIKLVSVIMKRISCASTIACGQRRFFDCSAHW